MILQVAYLSTGSLTLPAPPPACRLNVRWLFCRQTLGAESRAYPHTIVCGDDHRAFDCLGAKRDHRRGFVPMRPPRGSWAIPCLRPCRPSYSALAKASHLLSSRLAGRVGHCHRSGAAETPTIGSRICRRSYTYRRYGGRKYRMMLTRAGKYCVERTRPGEPASKTSDFATQSTAHNWIERDKEREAALTERRHVAAKHPPWWINLWWRS